MRTSSQNLNVLSSKSRVKKKRSLGNCSINEDIKEHMLIEGGKNNQQSNEVQIEISRASSKTLKSQEKVNNFGNQTDLSNKEAPHKESERLSSGINVKLHDKNVGEILLATEKSMLDSPHTPLSPTSPSFHGRESKRSGG